MMLVRGYARLSPVAAAVAGFIEERVARQFRSFLAKGPLQQR